MRAATWTGAGAAHLAVCQHVDREWGKDDHAHGFSEGKFRLGVLVPPHMRAEVEVLYAVRPLRRGGKNRNFKRTFGVFCTPAWPSPSSQHAFTHSAANNMRPSTQSTDGNEPIRGMHPK